MWEGSTRRHRLPPDWPARRRDAFRRHNGRCHLCGQPGADTIDHIRRGDDHAPSNLAPVHERNPPHCHRAKSSREGGQAAGEHRRTRAALRKRPPEPHPGER